MSYTASSHRLCVCLTMRLAPILLATQGLCHGFNLSGNQFEMSSVDMGDARYKHRKPSTLQGQMAPLGLNTESYKHRKPNSLQGQMAPLGLNTESYEHLNLSSLPAQYTRKMADSGMVVNRTSPTAGKLMESLLSFHTANSTMKADNQVTVSPDPLLSLYADNSSRRADNQVTVSPDPLLSLYADNSSRRADNQLTASRVSSLSYPSANRTFKTDRQRKVSSDPLLSFLTTNGTLRTDRQLKVSSNPLSQHSVTMQKPQPDSVFQTFHLFADDCFGEDSDFIEYSAMQGEVLGLYIKTSIMTKIVCQWKISVPEGMFMFVEFDSTLEPCPFQKITVAYEFPVFLEDTIGCPYGTSSASYIPLSNFVHFRLESDGDHFSNITHFRVRFRATRENLRTKLNVLDTTAVSGYLTSPGYDGKRLAPPLMRAVHRLDVPENHTIMLSYESFALNYMACGDDILFVLIDRASQKRTVISTCRTELGSVSIVRVPLEIHFITDYHGQPAGFKFYFTIQPFNRTPQILKSGLLNCSVPYYASFEQHVQCNMKQECEGGEDEGGHCPFSSPACNGSVAVNNKCYTLYPGQFNSVSPSDSLQSLCLQKNANVGMMKTREEWEAFSLLLHRRNKFGGVGDKIGIGLIGYEAGMPQYYRRMFRWVDNTVSYNINASSALIKDFNCERFVPAMCAFYDIQTIPAVRATYCQQVYSKDFVCEFYVGHANKTKVSRPQLHFTPSDFQWSRHSVVVCPDGHTAFRFLSCHRTSHCGVLTSLHQCPFSSLSVAPPHTLHSDLPQLPKAVSTFACQDGNDTVPYSFLCDFWEDCGDGSDEEICDHSQPCEGYRCSNGQCIELSQVCDTFLHCVDYSDENDCPVSMGHWNPPRTYSVHPPAIINFTSSGSITHTTMNAADACPETHFRCQGQLDYCLPVYVLCNGVYDCLGHEDEAGCDQAELCPGFYRCWNSAVCLHPDHLCDGVTSCPRHDDEMFCAGTCPEECQCQGNAFVCDGRFHTQQFPQLRYLDAAGSGIKPQHVLNHSYLIWTSMQSCGVDYLPKMYNPNLRHLDLSENLLTVVSMDVFVDMVNLETLSLAGNPLVSLIKATAVTRESNLKQLDLSRTELLTFDGDALQFFSYIQVLNISDGKLIRILENSFQFASSLQRLDIRGNPVKEYPFDVLKGLSAIQFLYSSDFRFCCRAILPDHYDSIVCQSPQDELSSCEDLLRSNTYRVCLWLMAVMSVLGNAGSFLVRCVAQLRVTKTGFNVFVTNLCLADLLMGVYLAMLGTADSLYRGQYLSYERSWTASAVCKMAGFLSLMSSEVSAFVIFLITLDRFIVLRFPLSPNKFRTRSALVASSIVWTVGFLLAVVPLLPVTSHWEFYGQSGICIPLPITRKTFKGRDYSFGIIIILNFVIFIFIALGQIIIYTSVRSHQLTTDTTKTSQDSTIARRLLTVVLSDFACWFPIGLLGLLASAGVPIPGEVNVAVAIFVLPLNSALNPFLYTFNMMAEKRRKALEVKLMKLLGTRPVARETDPEQSASFPGSTNIHDDLTIEDAVSFLAKSLVSKTTTREKIKALLAYIPSEENG